MVFWSATKGAATFVIAGAITTGLLATALPAAGPAGATEIDPRLDNGVHFYDKKYCNCRTVDARDIEITPDGAKVFPGQPNQEAYSCVKPSPDGQTSYRCLGVEDDILYYDGRCLLTGKAKGV